MNIYTIYKATNLINGKVYIGFDSNWPARISHHKKDFNLERKTNIIFYRAIKKYGWENFSWEIVYQSKDATHTLSHMEEYFIRENNSYINFENSKGYNMTMGGEGTLGLQWAESSKEKIRKPKTPEHRMKNSLSHVGKKIPRDVVEKAAKSRTGLKRSAEFKQAQSIRAKENGWKPPGINLSKENYTEMCKKVSQGVTKLWELRRQNGTASGNFIWITDDISNIKIRSNENIPQGWRRGRTMKHDAVTGYFIKQGNENE